MAAPVAGGQGRRRAGTVRRHAIRLRVPRRARRPATDSRAPAESPGASVERCLVLPRPPMPRRDQPAPCALAHRDAGQPRVTPRHTPRRAGDPGDDPTHAPGGSDCAPSGRACGTASHSTAWRQTGADRGRSSRARRRGQRSGRPVAPRAVSASGCLGLRGLDRWGCPDSHRGACDRGTADPCPRAHRRAVAGPPTGWMREGGCPRLFGLRLTAPPSRPQSAGRRGTPSARLGWGTP